MGHHVSFTKREKAYLLQQIEDFQERNLLPLLRKESDYEECLEHADRMYKAMRNVITRPHGMQDSSWTMVYNFKHLRHALRELEGNPMYSSSRYKKDIVEMTYTNTAQTNPFIHIRIDDSA